MLKKKIEKKIEEIRKKNPKKANNIYWFLYTVKYLSFLDSLRRAVFSRIKYFLKYKNKKDLKVHLGCGSKRKKGFINIDFRKTNATNLVLDARKLPFNKNSVKRIESYHLIEHMKKVDVERMIKQWFKILKPRGMVVIECPNVDEAMKKYLKGDEKMLDSIFGLQRYKEDVHLYGYNFKRLKKMLEKEGFTNIVEKKPADYHSKNEPCLRIEAEKD